MKFGRSLNFKEINHLIPSFNKKFKPLHKKKIYLGAPIWRHLELVQKIDPSFKRGDYLEVYSRFFDAIELNSTFYSVPSLETQKKWLYSTSKSSNFKFCPKCPKVISHYGKGFSQEGAEVSSFLNFLKRFGEKLGVCFIQFPAHFSLDLLFDDLMNFIKRLPRDLNFQFEFRHESFFQESSKLLELENILLEKNCSFVILDTSGKRDLIKDSFLSNQQLVRFVANGLDQSDYSRLDRWTQEINSIDSGEIYFFFHQENEAQCFELTKYLREKLNIKKAYEYTEQLSFM